MVRKFVVAQLILAGMLAAQTEPLRFEVAAIKPAPPLTAQTASSVGVHIDRNQMRFGSLALRDYIAMGFNMRLYQIEGPDWIATERYDLQATLPPMAEGRKIQEKEFAELIGPLLEERFALKTHKIKRDFPIYALTLAKDGIKAKESPMDPEEDSLTVGGTGNQQGTVVNLGRGMTLSVGGNKIAATKMPMLVLAETLARFLDRPVQDHTGLTSSYDVELELTQEDFQAMAIRAALANGATLPPQALKIMDTATLDSLHAALAKFGLKLEQKKASLDVLVVDSVNRTPTEN